VGADFEWMYNKLLKLKPSSVIMLKKYITFMREHEDRVHGDDDHHGLPRCLFPQFEDFEKFPGNKVTLTRESHATAHDYLTAAFSETFHVHKLRKSRILLTAPRGSVCDAHLREIETLAVTYTKTEVWNMLFRRAIAYQTFISWAKTGGGRHVAFKPLETVCGPYRAALEKLLHTHTRMEAWKQILKEHGISFITFEGWATRKGLKFKKHEAPSSRFVEEIRTAARIGSKKMVWEAVLKEHDILFANFNTWTRRSKIGKTIRFNPRWKHSRSGSLIGKLQKAA